MKVTAKNIDFVMPTVPEHPDEDDRKVLEGHHSKPNTILKDLLRETGVRSRVLGVPEFLDSHGVRATVTERVKEAWYESDLKDEASFELMVLGHTVEAMQENPDVEFLYKSIGNVLSRTTARPTLSFVTLPVVQVVKDPTFQSEYLDRMLAEPGQSFEDGWFPVGMYERLALLSLQKQLAGSPADAHISRLIGHEQPA